MQLRLASTLYFIQIFKFKPSAKWLSIALRFPLTALMDLPPPIMLALAGTVFTTYFLMSNTNNRNINNLLQVYPGCPCKIGGGKAAHIFLRNACPKLKLWRPTLLRFPQFIFRSHPESSTFQFKRLTNNRHVKGTCKGALELVKFSFMILSSHASKWGSSYLNRSVVTSTWIPSVV